MIQVKNVTKKYGKFYAVRNINFEVKEGEIVGFLGRNGAGKTTTMNMLTGYIEPTSGEITINGYDIEKDYKKVKSLIGYMPEGTPLYSDLTVKEFVNYMAELKLVPRKIRKKAVEEAIKNTGLEKVQKNLTRNLSRGYRQRVSLAGAIVGNPKILILDEPTVGLDPKQVIEIRELIKSFRKDHTVILSSHILSEVSQICEKVIIIDKGEIVAVDTPENLEKNTTETEEMIIIVDDMSDKFIEVKESIPEIRDIILVSENDDNSKTYKLVIDKDKDIRKDIFSNCAKLNIAILEMKKEEKSLEEAFIKIVENRTEYSQKEVEKMQYQKELEEMREELEEKKKKKQDRKQAKKEAKARKEAKKEAKKDAKQKDKEEKMKENKEDSKPKEKETKKEKKEKNQKKEKSNKKEDKE